MPLSASIIIGGLSQRCRHEPGPFAVRLSCVFALAADSNTESTNIAPVWCFGGQYCLSVAKMISRVDEHGVRILDITVV
jgi:hypothetical protein